MEDKFSKFSLMRSKALCLGVLKSAKWMSAQSTAYALRNMVNSNLSKKMKKISAEKKSVKSFLRYMDEFLS